MNSAKNVTAIFVEMPLRVEEPSLIPSGFRLYPNYPNPLNPETRIRYELPQAAKVKLAIYNLVGQEIRTLVHEEQLSGAYAVAWQGKDNADRQVASGVYIYKIVAADFTDVKKLILLR